MSLLYSDPRKDNPYGKLQGEMVDVWTKLSFDEVPDFSRHLEKSPSNQGFTPSLIINNLCLMTIANGGIRLGVCGNLAIA